MCAIIAKLRMWAESMEGSGKYDSNRCQIRVRIPSVHACWAEHGPVGAKREDKLPPKVTCLSSATLSDRSCREGSVTRLTFEGPDSLGAFRLSGFVLRPVRW